MTFAVVQAGEAFFLQLRSAVVHGNVISNFEASGLEEKESRLVSCSPVLTDAIQCKASLAKEASPDGHALLWIPVFLGNRVSSCVRLEYATACDDAAVALIRGLIEVYSNHKNLIDYSERDALTGLLNRRTFDTRFARLIVQGDHARQPQLQGQEERRQRAQAMENWLAVVDIDHFKKINDRFGHVYGDEVLILVANLLKTSFRSNERIFRFGGEEFVVLLRAVTLENAWLTFERFRKAVEEYDFPQVGRVTVSIGFASIIGHTPVVIVGHADQALYYAKENGRNQTQNYDQLLASRLLQVEATNGSVEFF